MRKPDQQCLQQLDLFLKRCCTIKTLGPLLIIGILACNPDSSQVSLSDSITEQSRAAESLLHQWTQAYIDSDTAALNRIIADDWIYTDGNGRTTTKQQAITGFVKSGDRYESIEYDGLNVRIYDKVAILTGNETMHIQLQNGDCVAYRLRFTDVYHLQDNSQWRAVATHTSPLNSTD